MFFIGSLTCLSIFLAWRLAAPWCAPFLAVCVTALLQVLAAMGGVYHEVRLAVAVLSFLSLLPVCLSLFTAGAPRRRYMWTAAPSLLFAGLLLLFAWHYAGARLVYWDEYFWGGFVKHLVQENSLWAWGSVLPRHDSVLLYPPMVTILQALLQPMGTFSEPAIALGEGAVLLSATGVVIHLARERGLSFWPVCFCALLTFGLLRSLGAHVDYGSYIFGYGESLQTAFYTALALLVIFSSCRDRLLRLLLQGGCAVLILCKPTGIFSSCVYWVPLRCGSGLVCQGKGSIMLCGRSSAWSGRLSCAGGCGRSIVPSASRERPEQIFLPWPMLGDWRPFLMPFPCMPGRF